MGTCRLCGQPAGFLRFKHPACTAKHARGLSTLLQLSEEAAKGGTSVDTLSSRVDALAKESFISRAEVTSSYVRAWEGAAEHFLDDGNLDEDEERHLVEFQQHLGLSQSDLDSRGVFSRVLKGGILRDVMHGKVPSRLRIEGPTPFNFQRNEQLVWVFNGVEYLEDKTRREYVGRSSGFSFRVARGIYYRVGAFRGHPIEKSERVHVDSGSLGITTKHLYFAGPKKSFRIRHDKIVSFIPFSDGVGVVRDAATAKPQIFVTGDGWFTYNLLSNISQVDGGAN